MEKDKYGILTFHRALNYGAVFQTYALQKAIQKLGEKADIIDYRAAFNEERFRQKKFTEICNIKELYNILFHNGYIKCNRAVFEKFCSMMSYSDICSTTAELAHICGKYKRIISGSDQVWNLVCTEEDSSYFLPFLDDPYAKTSYAASFGGDTIPKEFLSYYKQWLGSFSLISVREKSGVKLVKDLTQKKAYYVVDPVFLLSKEEWITIADFKRVPSAPYVLLYLMMEDHKLIEFAKKFAKENKLDVLYMSDRLFKLRGAKNLREVTPEQWLGLFNGASYVFTNSFHGTAFSIIFKKQFFLNYISKSPVNHRIENIINEYGFQNRLISEWNGKPCDFNAVKKNIDDNIQYSYMYLKDHILGENNEA